MFGENANGNGTTVSFSTNGDTLPNGNGNGNGAVTASGRPLTPQELQALQNAATSFGGAVQRGLSLGVAGVSLMVGVGLGYLIWGRKGTK